MKPLHLGFPTSRPAPGAQTTCPQLPSSPPAKPPLLPLGAKQPSRPPTLLTHPPTKITNVMVTAHILTIVTAILIPCVVLTWLCCLAYCFVKNLQGKLDPGRQQQNTAVTVVVAPSAAPSALFTRSRPPSSRVDATYAPVTSHLASSMTLSDFLKSGDLNLNDSLGPRYYPPEPVSRDVARLQETTPQDQMFPSPMAPLEPPWPHLPPINSHKQKPSSSFSSRVNHLSSQILNLPRQQDGE